MKYSAHHLELDSLRFSVFSSDDVRKLSVAKIVTSSVFDSLGHALPGGLYDSAMGEFLRSKTERRAIKC